MNLSEISVVNPEDKRKAGSNLQGSKPPKQKQPRTAKTMAFSMTYLNSRQMHDEENSIFEGPVKIEDRASAQKGQILLKERYAVLCQTRLLLFKGEKESRRSEKGLALAVYPIVRSDFSLLQAPPLTEYNFASRKAFQS